MSEVSTGLPSKPYSKSLWCNQLWWLHLLMRHPVVKKSHGLRNGGVDSESTIRMCLNQDTLDVNQLLELNSRRVAAVRAAPLASNLYPSEGAKDPGAEVDLGEYLCVDFVRPCIFARSCHRPPGTPRAR